MGTGSELGKSSASPQGCRAGPRQHPASGEGTIPPPPATPEAGKGRKSMRLRLKGLGLLLLLHLLALHLWVHFFPALLRKAAPTPGLPCTRPHPDLLCKASRAERPCRGISGGC